MLWLSPYIQRQLVLFFIRLLVQQLALTDLLLSDSVIVCPRSQAFHRSPREKFACPQNEAWKQASLYVEGLRSWLLHDGK